MVSYTPISLHYKKCGQYFYVTIFQLLLASLLQKEANATVK